MHVLPPSFSLRSWKSYALVAAALSLLGLLHHAYTTTYSEPDIRFIWLAGRMWCSGADPYIVPFTTPQYSDVVLTFPYPLPIVLLTLPLTLMPLGWVAALWAFTGLVGVLALPHLLLRTAPPWLSLVTLAYLPFLSTMEVVQVEPILLLVALTTILLHRSERHALAGLLLPLTLLKPQVGLGLFFAVSVYTMIQGVPRRWWLGVAAGFALWWGGSLLVDPTWPLRWLPQLTQFSKMHRPTAVGITSYGAPLALLAAGLVVIAWRRRDAEIACGAALTLGLLMAPLCCLYSQSVLLLPLVFVAGRRPFVALAALLLNLSTFAWTAAGFTIPANMALAIYTPVLAALVIGLRAHHVASAAMPPVVPHPMLPGVAAVRRWFERHRVQ